MDINIKYTCGSPLFRVLINEPRGLLSNPSSTISRPLPHRVLQPRADSSPSIFNHKEVSSGSL